MLPIASWATQGLIPPTRRADAKKWNDSSAYFSQRFFSYTKRLKFPLQYGSLERCVRRASLRLCGWCSLVFLFCFGFVYFVLFYFIMFIFFLAFQLECWKRVLDQFNFVLFEISFKEWTHSGRRGKKWLMHFPYQQNSSLLLLSVSPVSTQGFGS